MEESKKRMRPDRQVFFFMIALCFVCALLLASAAFLLEKPQQAAKEFDQSKQMLIAAKILNHKGYFEIFQKNGQTVRARWDSDQKLFFPDPQAKQATDAEIKQVSELRIRPLLTDSMGNVFTLEEKQISLPHYLAEHKKTGYANLPVKLFYVLLPNQSDASTLSTENLSKNLSQVTVYLIPVSGFGLWAPIYGFIALGPDGNQVIGTTWYEHGETPGLGANITEPWWQNQFYGKQIFQESGVGKIDFKTADLGIIVVKGKVRDVYGNSPKSKSAVDGMSGATLTGDGVTQAYRNSLNPYRSFLTKRGEDATTKNSP